MSNEAQTNTQDTEEKILFFYPGWNEEFPRRVLAGLQEGQKIQVAEAVCYPGTYPTVVPVKLSSGHKAWVIDPGRKPDTFAKKVGKSIAVARVRGWRDIPTKDPKAPKRVYPGQKLICTIDFSGSDITVTLLDDATAPVLHVPFPVDPTHEGVSAGRAFVDGVAAYLAHWGFPKKAVKEKAEPTPTPKSAVPVSPGE